MVDKVGVIGLGVMGSAMSHHLIAAGYSVSGYDIDRSRIDALVGRGGSGAVSAAEVAHGSEVVLLSLPSVEALEHASREVAEGAHAGLIAVEMGTLPLPAKQTARDRLAEVGVELMDVPVSGTGLQAADGTLVVMASGTQSAFDAVKPILDRIGRATYYLGPFPNGSIMKFIANLLVSVHTLAAAEAHTLGLAAGMEPDVVQRVIADGVGRSAMFEIRGPMMVADAYDPPSARLDIIKKDAGIIQDFARSIGATTPLLDAALPLYRSASEAGLGDLDAAALCRHLEQLDGIDRR